MRVSIYLGTVIFTTVFGSINASLSVRDKATINNGLAAGTAIANAIETYDFDDSMTKVAKNLSPFLGALGPIVALVLGLFGTSETTQLREMRRNMKHIDERFDRLDGEFADLNRKIDYIHIQIEFGIIEHKILAMSTQFQKFYNAPAGAVQQEKKDFIDSYLSDYQHSGDKIVDGILNEKGTFTESLGDAAMRYSEYDRKATQEYMLGVLKLLLTAVKIELAYKKANGVNDADFNYIKGLWETKISKVRAKMISIDQIVAGKYKEQMTKDVERYAKDNPSLSHLDFSSKVYNELLKKKFYWRDWMVVAYNDITGSDKHYQHVCDGIIKFRSHGRNIVVASVDKKKPLVAHSTAARILSRTITYTSHTNPRLHGTILYQKKSAQDVYNTFPASARAHCSPYAAIGLEQDGSGAQYQGPANRLVKMHQRYYQLHIFG